MIKRALITYAWDENRGENRWLFWLQKKLEAQGFEVSMAPLAKTNRTSQEIISDLQSIYSIPDESLFRVQYDPGSLTILRYLEHLVASNRKETALLIAETTDIKLAVLYSADDEQLKNPEYKRLKQ